MVLKRIVVRAGNKALNKEKSLFTIPQSASQTAPVQGPRKIREADFLGWSEVTKVRPAGRRDRLSFEVQHFKKTEDNMGNIV